MDKKTVHARIDEQIAEARRQCGLPAHRMNASIHIFKPDSPKLETVVAVDIGRLDKRVRVKTSLRFFYAPAGYGYPSAAELEKDILAYWKSPAGKPVLTPFDPDYSSTTR